MKREELIALGISEEIAKQIMSINGTDIESAKTKAGQATEKVTQELENLKSELESNKQTLEQANAQIEKFKGLDVEGIKAQAEEWKTKYSEFELKSKADKEAFDKAIAEQNRDFAIKELMSGQKFSNEFVKNAAIEDFKKQELKFADGKFLGADDYFKNLAEKNPGVFVVEAPADTTPLPQFTQQNTNQTPFKKGISLTEAMQRANKGEKVDFSQLEIQ